MFVDNQAAIAISKMEGNQNRSKHMNSKDFFGQDMLESGEFDFEYCGTKEKKADIMTKSLDCQKHHKGMEI